MDILRSVKRRLLSLTQLNKFVTISVVKDFHFINLYVRISYTYKIFLTSNLSCRPRRPKRTIGRSTGEKNFHRKTRNNRIVLGGKYIDERNTSDFTKQLEPYGKYESSYKRDRVSRLLCKSPVLGFPNRRPSVTTYMQVLTRESTLLRIIKSDALGRHTTVMCELLRCSSGCKTQFRHETVNDRPLVFVYRV